MVLVDMTLSLKCPEGEISPVSEVYQLLTKIHDILDSAVSKWVGNTACILASF